MMNMSRTNMILAGLMIVLIAPTTRGVHVDHTFGPSTLVFVPNLLGHDSQSRFQVRGAGTTVFFTDESMRIEMTASAQPKSERRVRRLDARATDNGRPSTHTLHMNFLGARPTVPEGTVPAATVVSSFSGQPSEWRTNIGTWAGLVYRDLWAGIDLIWLGDHHALKYELQVDPGADLSQVRFGISGATHVAVKEQGDLEIVTPVRTLVDKRPVAWQDLANGRVNIPVAWVVDQRGSDFSVGFRAEAYDPSAPLVIDPVVLVYATFLGGSGDDRGLGVALDPAGNTYICGETPNGSSFDAYVAKYDPTGTTLIYVGLLGGSGYDACYDIAVDDAGQAYLVGATLSSSRTFPDFGGPDKSYNGGGGDAFVCKVNAQGTALVYCGYLGGSGLDFAEGVRVDAAGAVYITGVVYSTEITFPTRVGPDLTYNGDGDTFVAKLKPFPNARRVSDNYDYIGYIGGSNVDVGITAGFVTNGHIAIDTTGAAYVSGMTRSGSDTFPNGNGFGSLTTWDKSHGGGYDAYVVKVAPGGSGLVWAGYVGGASDDFGFGMAVDSAGNAYITGDSASSESSFQPIVGPDMTYNGNTDTFVCKINTSGTSRVYCGYLGGSLFDQGHGVAVDAAGHLYVAGHAVSTESTFPVVNGPDLTHNGSGPDIGDAVICKLKLVPNDPNPTNNYEFCGYVGGSGEDHAFWVALDGSGGVFVVGDTNSNEATFPDGDGFSGLSGVDQTANGNFDAFLVKVTE